MPQANVKRMKDQWCKMFGFMLCLLVTACSYDWGGSVLIIEEKAADAHLGEENVEDDMDQDDVQEKLCRRLLRAYQATWDEATSLGNTCQIG